MRSTFLLLKDIQAALVEAFKAFPFDVPPKDIKDTSDSNNNDEKLREPNVWIGHAPPKQSMPTGATSKMPPGDPPFMIVRILDGDSKIDNTRALVHEVKVGVLCCVHSHESYDIIEAGYHDILNMMDRAMMVFQQRMYWENRHWFIPQTEPLKWVSGLQKELGSIYEAGMHDQPFFGAAVIATFKAAVPPQPPIFGITDSKERL